MLPQTGPIAFRIPGISGVSVPAASSGVQVKYRWPATYKLVGIDMCLRSGSDLELAATSLLMIDDKNIVLASNGFGTVTRYSPLAGRGVPTLNHSLGGRPQAFQRIVRAGDIWVFQVVNGNAGVDIIPELFFRIESAVNVQPIGGHP